MNILSNFMGRRFVLSGAIAAAIIVFLVYWSWWQPAAIAVPRYEVHGTVFRSGRPIPMPEFRIVFTHRETKRIGVGILDEHGRYRIENFREAGLPAGEYDVSISFPEGYLFNSSTSEVISADNELDTLEHKLAVYVPRKYRDPKMSGLTLTVVDRDVEFNVDMVD